MKLTDEERFALTVLFPGSTGIDLCVRNALDEARVIDRRFTGVGFFSSIALPLQIDEREEGSRDWNFQHTELDLGGSFMCAISHGGSIDLEAVALTGEWPRTFDPRKFSEM
ncbi:MAG TPA: hypothetical protein VN289_05465 [Paraburkholderia sp.]|jgi:hypothetical protein|nr:hypothetical protein [Paraburkholderia sp.]